MSNDWCANWFGHLSRSQCNPRPCGPPRKQTRPAHGKRYFSSGPATRRRRAGHARPSAPFIGRHRRTRCRARRQTSSRPRNSLPAREKSWANCTTNHCAAASSPFWPRSFRPIALKSLRATPTSPAAVVIRRAAPAFSNRTARPVMPCRASARKLGRTWRASPRDGRICCSWTSSIRASRLRRTTSTIWSVTKDGRVLNGLIAGETTESVTLRREEGQQDTIPRSDIEELRASGKSIMPDGLEEKLTPDQLADLLEFLHHPDAKLLN